MKLRMFPLFIAIIAGIVALTVGLAHAQPYATVGPLSLPIPWQNMNAVYLYNETDKINEVGGEMVIAQLKAGSYQGNPLDIDMTVGGVLDPSGNNVGTGFVGVNLWIPNPIPAVTILSQIQPGIFSGYEIAGHRWIFGLKAAIPIFKS